jgi:hypothetical protein
MRLYPIIAKIPPMMKSIVRFEPNPAFPQLRKNPAATRRRISPMVRKLIGFSWMRKDLHPLEGHLEQIKNDKKNNPRNPSEDRDEYAPDIDGDIHNGKEINHDEKKNSNHTVDE